VPGYRNAAGLPDWANLGRFITEGVLVDIAGVTVREALKIGDNLGGLDEIIIPDAENKVKTGCVQGVNPPF